jgi:hypothetical protein
MDKQVIYETRVACPHCGVIASASMPDDACQFFWECPHCRAVLRPAAGDCCVFCSYGDIPCPPIQRQRAGEPPVGCCCPS